MFTNEFASLGRMEAQTLNMPHIPILVIPHPLGGLKPQEVEERAKGVVDEIINTIFLPVHTLKGEA